MPLFRQILKKGLILDHPYLEWSKTELASPDTVLRDDDWTLLDATGNHIENLFNTGPDDLVGSWGWRG